MYMHKTLKSSSKTVLVSLPHFIKVSNMLLWISMSFCLALCIYVYIFDILNKIKQQPKVETSYMFVVSLKHLLSATEILNRIKDILLGLVLEILGRASFKKWFLFYMLLSSENDLYAKKTPQILLLVSSLPLTYMMLMLSEFFYCLTSKNSVL